MSSFRLALVNLAGSSHTLLPMVSTSAAVLGSQQWAIDTGDGLILIDALDNTDEAREIIVPGIQKFGFEGSDIKAVIVTHKHADHYGGARQLQETSDTPIYMSEVAWDGLANDPASPGGLIEPPSRNLTLEDGVGITFGNVTVIPITTPGHTAGTVSLFFPVYENGVKHGAFSSFSLIQAVRSH